MTEKDQQQQLEHLAEMRALMERSTRFLSLSGLSGVWAGLCALAGAAVVYLYLGTHPLAGDDYYYYERALTARRWGIDYQTAFVLIALGVLAAALAGGLYFTWRKAHRAGLRVWSASSRRMLYALAVPLCTGGIFCLEMLHWGLPGLVAPATLVFYGLALVNGSKYTLRDVEYLGLSQIALGLLGLWYLGTGLDLWAFGFGVLHIAYGAWMHFKYG